MRRTPNVVLGALAFLTSAAVLVIEIVAARLLAPYVGVTLETYTAIIGTVLAGIAGGAWLGGRVADRVSPMRALPAVLVGGGLLTLASIPILRIVGGWVKSTAPTLVIGLTAAAFLAPSIVLSMVSPLLAKARMVDLSTTGRTIGSLSALSTSGALAGSFITGFVLIPHFRSRLIIGIVGGLLIAIGTLIGPLTNRSRTRLGGTSLGLIVAVGGGGTVAVSNWRDSCQSETAYFCASIETNPALPSRKWLLLDDSYHSLVDVKDPTFLGFEYTRAFNIAINAWRPEPLKVRALHIGGGGFTMPRLLKATRPGSDSLVMEIDDRLVDFDKKNLALKLAPDLRRIGGDGRMGLRRQPDDSYDLVIGDAFGGQSIPWHLTTKEVAADIDRVLIKNGLYIINVIDSPPQKFIKAEIATVKSVFANVAVLSTPDALAGTDGANFVIVAAQSPLPLRELQRLLNEDRDLNFAMLEGKPLTKFVGDAKVLTDELAPVAQLVNE